MLTECTLFATAPSRFPGPAALAADPDLPRLEVDGMPGLVTRAAGWEQLLAPIGDTVDDADWWIVGRYDAPLPCRVWFDGLTFPATVFVDGDPVTDVGSMFLPVHVHLTAGPHEIAIRFASLTQWLKKRRGRGRWRSNLVAEQKLRWARTTLLGRAPAYSGSPAPVGIWRRIELTDGVSIDDLTVQCVSEQVEVSGRCVDVTGTGVADADVDVRITHEGTIATSTVGRCGPDGTFAIALTVDSPHLWWPRGYGDQPLYDLDISVEGTVIRSRRIGFRTVDVTPARGFGVAVNGTPIFCRGAVWMPADPTDLRGSADTTREQLRLLADAGANMVRIPGGTAYEQPEFWDASAEFGILVWQDTMQATFDPPPELDDVVAAELAGELRALGGNPALAVVSGGNETQQQPEMLGLAADSRTMNLVDHRLPVIAAVAGVPYVPSSPSAPPRTGDLAIRPDTGVAHWFGVGGYLRPLTDVMTAGVGFAAESLAFSIPPTADAVDRHFGSSAPAGHHPHWKAGVPRDKGASWDFEDVRDHYVREVFGVDPMQIRRVDPDRYLQLGRVAVIAAMVGCFGFWRRQDSGCHGALVLSAKDLVPGAGWGLIDVDGAPKAPLSALRRIWDPLSVIVSDAGLSGLRIDIYNDSPNPLPARLILTAVDAGGRPVIDGSADIIVPERSSTTMHDSEITGSFRDLAHSYRFGPAVAQAVQVEVVGADPEHSVRDVIVIDPAAAPIRADLTARAGIDEAGTWYLDVTADAALRWVEIDVSGYRPADNYFHLAPGLTYRVALCGECDKPPSGRVSSVDAATAAKIVVTA